VTKRATISASATAALERLLAELRLAPPGSDGLQLDAIDAVDDTGRAVYPPEVARHHAPPVAWSNVLLVDGNAWRGFKQAWAAEVAPALALAGREAKIWIGSRVGTLRTVIEDTLAKLAPVPSEEKFPWKWVLLGLGGIGALAIAGYFLDDTEQRREERAPARTRTRSYGVIDGSPGTSSSAWEDDARAELNGSPVLHRAGNELGAAVRVSNSTRGLLKRRAILKPPVVSFHYTRAMPLEKDGSR
jgi:hypothetical protein